MVVAMQQGVVGSIGVGFGGALCGHGGVRPTSYRSWAAGERGEWRFEVEGFEGGIRDWAARWRAGADWSTASALDAGKAGRARVCGEAATGPNRRWRHAAQP